MDKSVVNKLLKGNHSQIIRKIRHKTKVFAYDLGQDLLGQHYKVAATTPSSFVARSARTASSTINGVVAPALSGVWVFVLRVFFLGVSATSTAGLRYFLQTDTALQGAVLRVFLRGVERCLREHSPGCGTTARIGAVAFIHRFGSSLNEHVHFHCCIIDGVFEPGDATGEATDQASGAVFHAASGFDAAALAGVQAMVRRRILRAFVRRGLIGKNDADVMGGWEHGGGFSLDASVCIGGDDRAGLERLLRYCARPPFALEHLQQLDAGHLMEQLAI